MGAGQAAAAAPAWVIVERAGTDDEYLISEHASRHEAERIASEWRRGGAEVDLMKREPDGALTTEF